MKFPADRSLATLLILAFAGVSIGLATPSFGQSEEPAPPEEPSERPWYELEEEDKDSDSDDKESAKEEAPPEAPPAPGRW